MHFVRIESILLTAQKQHKNRLNYLVVHMIVLANWKVINPKKGNPTGYCSMASLVSSSHINHLDALSKEEDRVQFTAFSNGVQRLTLINVRIKVAPKKKPKKPAMRMDLLRYTGMLDLTLQLDSELTVPLTVLMDSCLICSLDSSLI